MSPSNPTFKERISRIKPLAAIAAAGETTEIQLPRRYRVAVVNATFGARDADLVERTARLTILDEVALGEDPRRFLLRVGEDELAAETGRLRRRRELELAMAAIKPEAPDVPAQLSQIEQRWSAAEKADRDLARSLEEEEIVCTFDRGMLLQLQKLLPAIIAQPVPEDPNMSNEDRKKKEKVLNRLSDDEPALRTLMLVNRALGK